MKRLQAIILCIYWGSLYTAVFAQRIDAHLYFEKDTFSLGMPQKLTLEIIHPDTTLVLFPSHNLISHPSFRWISQSTRPTETHQHISKDITEYSIQIFELAPTFSIQLPYKYIVGEDTLKQTLYSDTLRWVERIPPTEDLEGLPFRKNAGVIAILDPINYFWFIIIAVGIIIISGVVGYVLRNPVRIFLKRQIIKREWGSIKRQMQRLHTQAKNQEKYMDELNKIWKDLLAQFQPEQATPLRSLTTSELIPFLENNEMLSLPHKQTLIETAKTSDQIIYAGKNVPHEALYTMEQEIKSVIDSLFLRKLQNIK